MWGRLVSLKGMENMVRVRVRDDVQMSRWEGGGIVIVKGELSCARALDGRREPMDSMTWGNTGAKSMNRGAQIIQTSIWKWR